MSGKKSRVKGQRGQLEAAKILKGEVIARTGFDGPDVRVRDGVHLGPLYDIEVKRIAKLPAMLKAWLAQTEREGGDALLLREDRGPWYIVVRVPEYLEVERGSDQ